LNKIRVHELAKELNITSHDLINKLAELNVIVNNHMSSVPDDAVKKILQENKKQEEKMRENKDQKNKNKTLRDFFKSSHKNFDMLFGKHNNKNKAKNDLNQKRNDLNGEEVLEEEKNDFNQEKIFDQEKNDLNKEKVLEEEKSNSSEEKFLNKDKSGSSKEKVLNKNKSGLNKNKVRKYTHENKNKNKFVKNTRYDLSANKRSVKDFDAFFARKSFEGASFKKLDEQQEKPQEEKIKSVNISLREKKIGADFFAFELGKIQEGNKQDEDILVRIASEKININLEIKQDKNKSEPGVKNKSGDKRFISKSDIKNIIKPNILPEINLDKKINKNFKESKRLEKKKNVLKPKKEIIEIDSRERERKARKKNKDREKKLELNLEKDLDEIIKLPESMTLKFLSDKINKPIGDLIKVLMSRGLIFTQNKNIDFALASQLAEKFDVLVELEEEDKLEIKTFDDEKNFQAENQVERPPVVVVMGHVDHGKTSLLDAIRHTSVIETEAGGITQHIGAYTVKILDKLITFLDTPGHEAFTAMRMRGAQATDIAILVVAADDGIMPQTIEAINHAKAANVSIIVAINKIDKPGANIERVKQELTEHGLLPEEWGGDIMCVPVSAKNNIGLENLLEMIILLSQLKELKANPDKAARGVIIEACLDKTRGPVATVLVQEGTLKLGDPVYAGTVHGKVRAMFDDKFNKVKKASPSIPVEILGLSAVPNAGDIFCVTQTDKQARIFAETAANKLNKNNLAKISLSDLFNKIQTGNIKDLNIIIKADVQGSVEAVRSSLEKLSNSEIKIRIIHGGVGAITESDIMLASTSNAIVIGFNVRPEPSAKSMADNENIDIKLYRIIYDAIEDIKLAMTGMLDPVYQEKFLGRIEIRKLFKASKLGTIGGSYVLEGKITRSSKIRLIRDGIIIHEGEVASLRKGKDDVREVNSGYECGVLLEKFNDLKENDILEAYTIEEIPRDKLPE